jgi:hypothetical protein
MAFDMVSEAPQGCTIYEAFSVAPGGSVTKTIPAKDCGTQEVNVKLHTSSGIIDAQKYGGPDNYLGGSGDWIVVGNGKKYFVSRIAQ